MNAVRRSANFPARRHLRHHGRHPAGFVLRRLLDLAKDGAAGSGAQLFQRGLRALARQLRCQRLGGDRVLGGCGARYAASLSTQRLRCLVPMAAGWPELAGARAA